MENAEIAEPFLGALFPALILTCGAVLSVSLLCKFSSRKSWFSRKLFPCEKRTTVSWGFPDVVVIFLLYVSLAYFCAVIAHTYLQHNADENIAQIAVPPSLDQGGDVSQDDLSREHPLTILLVQGKKKPSILLVCFLMAVVAAPLCEEFLFRVVLQGWLQSLEEFLRRLGIGFFEVIPRGFVSVFTVALIFSLIHWREPASEPMRDPNILFYHMLAQMTANFATVLFGVVYLVLFRNVAVHELGIVPKNILSDVRGVVLIYLMIIVPMFMIQIGLKSLWPESVTDPVTLMVLAMMLGILFFRTNRFVPVFSLHMIFNFVSFSLLLLFF